jgi:Flp pilus assembly protein TadG
VLIPLKKESGVYTIFFALGMTVLFGFIGLAVDTARLLVVKTELQNATDACALAAVRELNMQNDSTQRAVGAGLFTANRNFKSFQSFDVNMQITDITFAESLDGPFSTLGSGASSLSSFVKCESSDDSFTTVFLKVLGVDSLIPVARSIATLSGSSTTCSIPMALCSSASTLAKGQKLVLGTGTGSVAKWSNVLGANQLSNSEYTTLLTQHGMCQAMTELGRCIGVPDATTITVSARDMAWNSRFGIYRSSATSPASAVPDLTGFGYRDADPRFTPIPTGGAHQDYFQKSVNRSSFQSTLTGYVVSPQSTHVTFGANRRLVVMPMVDCGAGGCGSGAKPIVGWACALMLAPNVPLTGSNQVPEFEYIGDAGALDSPCRSAGFAGGDGPMVPVLVQ